MASPSKTVRLYDLEPSQVATEVVDRVLERARADLELLGYEIERPDACPVGAAAARLTTWAQTGEGLYEDEVTESYELLLQAFSSSGREVPDGEPTDALSCVLLAAYARRALLRPSRGLLVSARALAALAGVATSRVHQLRGELPRISNPQAGVSIKAIAAARWLAARGVAGFNNRDIEDVRKRLECFRTQAAAMSADVARENVLRFIYDLHVLETKYPTDKEALESIRKHHNRLAEPRAKLRTLRPA